MNWIYIFSRAVWMKQLNSTVTCSGRWRPLKQISTTSGGYLLQRAGTYILFHNSEERGDARSAELRTSYTSSSIQLRIFIWYREIPVGRQLKHFLTLFFPLKRWHGATMAHVALLSEGGVPLDISRLKTRNSFVHCNSFESFSILQSSKRLQ